MRLEEGSLSKRFQFIVAAITAGVAIRFLLLLLPAPYVTDVYLYDVQAVEYLVNGVNPYGAHYFVPPPLLTPGASNVFAYLPGVFPILVPTSLMANPRVGLVASDIVVAASLFYLGARKGVYSAAYLLFPPTFLFSTWFVNNSLVAMAFLSVAVILEVRGRVKWSAALWGMAVAASQEVWFLFPLYAVYCIRRRRYSEVAVALGFAAIVVAPFLAWDPSSLVYDTALFQFARQPEAFIWMGPFGLNVNPSLQGILQSLGTSVPLVIRGALALVGLALAAWYVDGTLKRLMLAGTAFAAAGLFLLAGNLFWSYLELPFLTLLVWAALREHTASNGSSAPLNA